MKKFFVTVLCISVFCIGLGAIVEKAGASLRSDEKALALIKQARAAIGGEQSIAEVRSMVIKGSTIHTVKIDGATRTEQGETEIALQLPDKLSKMVKIGRHEGAVGEKIMSNQHDVIVVHGEGDAVDPGTKRFVIRKQEGENSEVEKVIVEGRDGEFTTSDGKKMIVRRAEAPNVENVIVRHDGKGEGMAGHGKFRQNELLRTVLSLLITAPEGMDVSYTYGGETDVDGTTCNLINAEFAGSTVKLYLSKASSLPVMMSYIGHAMPKIVAFKSKSPDGAAPASGDKMIFTHKVDAPESAEIQVRFSDHRGVGGVQLPYKWTTSVGGQTTEVFEVSSYEINPANIAEKVQGPKTLVRTKKEGN